MGSRVGEPLRVGVLLPTRAVVLRGEGSPSPDLVLTMAERVEAIGCDSVWVGDSLTAKPRLEPLATLAAVAARTKRVRLGTAVLLAALRHPVLLAQTVHTLDQLSGGRLTLAMGVGGTFTEAMRSEWAAADVPPLERAARLEETVALLRAFRQPERVSFSGRFVRYDGPAMQPRPVQQPGVPLWLACHARTGNERQYRRAATLADGIISITDSPQEYARVLRAVRGYAQEQGRDPESLHAAFYMTVNLNEDEPRAAAEAEAFLLRYYGVNHWGQAWGPFGSPSRVAERIIAYRDAGAQTVILRFAGFDQMQQLERLADKVLPKLV
ncbi:MAG: LLM class flavin-dependent oxidoreductase [Dehalococcoidia bacterium]|nr:LLM class flavin-dependent oxidoreductase [Dehalococcoidia bacterium]